MTEETLRFDTEVSRLLELVAHSLYSEKQIFLRELISNASDACERLQFLALTEPGLVIDDPDYRITISLDKRTRSLSVADNGIGMSRDELVDNLGTIARSGTAAFVDQFASASEGNSSFIGQFGVGFYSVFMVGDEVSVLTRKAGESQGWSWSSDGKGEFVVAEDDSAPARGTVVRIHLKEEDREFRDPDRIRAIVREYSDHIALPIMLDTGDEPEQLNEASALWKRPAREIEDAQYVEFYRHVSRNFDEPWLTVHFATEGRVTYTALLFVPSTRPFDLLHRDARPGIRLYVQRVFITGEYDELLPPYLRFLRGVVDADDLPLNVSRETLQHSPMLARIRRTLTRRILRDLKRKADDEPEEYSQFWDNFGEVLKEGIYVEQDHREMVVELCRFHSTSDEGDLISLNDYVSRMSEGQEAIYYLSADQLDIARTSPHLESFASQGIEVILLTDPVDEIWVQSLGSHDEKPLRSITQGAIDLGDAGIGEDGASSKTPVSADVESLLVALKESLGDLVKDVRVSGRLTESAVCLVADDMDLDVRLARLLSEHGQVSAIPPRILEVNPEHRLIQKLADGVAGEVDDVAHLLLDLARIAEGENVQSPAEFSSRFVGVLERSLGD